MGYKEKKLFRCDVYFETRSLYIVATNSRQAKKKARIRVKKLKVPKITNLEVNETIKRNF